MARVPLNVQEQVHVVRPVEVQERITEVPQNVIRETCIEESVPVTFEQTKFVPKVQVVEQQVHVPRRYTSEKIVPLPVIERRDKFVEVPTPIIQEEFIPVYRPVIQERTIEIPRPIVQERIVDVPRVEYRQVTTDRFVEVPQVQVEYCVREVEVPQRMYRHLPAPVPSPQLFPKEQLYFLPPPPVATEHVTMATTGPPQQHSRAPCAFSACCAPQPEPQAVYIHSTQPQQVFISTPRPLSVQQQQRQTSQLRNYPPTPMQQQQQVMVPTLQSLPEVGADRYTIEHEEIEPGCCGGGTTRRQQTVGLGKVQNTEVILTARGGQKQPIKISRLPDRGSRKHVEVVPPPAEKGSCMSCNCVDSPAKEAVSEVYISPSEMRSSSMAYTPVYTAPPAAPLPPISIATPQMRNAAVVEDFVPTPFGEVSSRGVPEAFIKTIYGPVLYSDFERLNLDDPLDKGRPVNVPKVPVERGPVLAEGEVQRLPAVFISPYPVPGTPRMEMNAPVPVVHAPYRADVSETHVQLSQAPAVVQPSPEPIVQKVYDKEAERRAREMATVAQRLQQEKEQLLRQQQQQLNSLQSESARRQQEREAEFRTREQRAQQQAAESERRLMEQQAKAQRREAEAERKLQEMHNNTQQQQQVLLQQLQQENDARQRRLHAQYEGEMRRRVEELQAILRRNEAERQKELAQQKAVMQYQENALRQLALVEEQQRRALEGQGEILQRQLRAGQQPVGTYTRRVEDVQYTLKAQQGASDEPLYTRVEPVRQESPTVQ